MRTKNIYKRVYMQVRVMRLKHKQIMIPFDNFNAVNTWKRMSFYQHFLAQVGS